MDDKSSRTSQTQSFVNELMQLLRCDNEAVGVQLRETVKEMVSYELSPPVYSYLFQCMNDETSKVCTHYMHVTCMCMSMSLCMLHITCYMHVTCMCMSMSLCMLHITCYMHVTCMCMSISHVCDYMYVHVTCMYMSCHSPSHTYFTLASPPPPPHRSWPLTRW